uniref:WAT1-related protein n=2 Tax=Kalanchoe fedtschenkoi TaxID=63787 RepID=A0A7N0TWM9_KALFE
MGAGRAARRVLEGAKPAALMVVVQTLYAGVNVFYKLAANDGMNLRVLVAYRLLFAAAFMVPLALVFESRRSIPRITWMVIFQTFLSGLFGGALYQNMYIGSLALTSATFVSAMTNLVPAITFVLAVSFRLEKLGLGSMGGKAKVAGTAVGICGAMVLTFYKGVEVNPWSTHIDLMDGTRSGRGDASGLRHDQALGALLAIGCCFAFAAWLIVQAKVSKRYPYPYSSTALMSLMASVQSVTYAFYTERDLGRWRLGWDIRLLTVVFSGIMASGVAVALIAWCVRLKGPLFVSVFSPLMLILVAIAGSLVLDERLHLGSVLGSVLIVFGLYTVLWGKGEEARAMAESTVATFDHPARVEPVEIMVVVDPPAMSAICNEEKEKEKADPITSLPKASVKTDQN